MFRALFTIALTASATGTKTTSRIVADMIRTAAHRLPAAMASRRNRIGHVAMQTITAHRPDVRNGLSTQNVDTTSNARNRTESVACVISRGARWPSIICRCPESVRPSWPPAIVVRCTARAYCSLVQDAAGVDAEGVRRIGVPPSARRLIAARACGGRQNSSKTARPRPAATDRLACRLLFVQQPIRAAPAAFRDFTNECTRQDDRL